MYELPLQPQTRARGFASSVLQGKGTQVTERITERIVTPAQLVSRQDVRAEYRGGLALPNWIGGGAKYRKAFKKVSTKRTYKPSVGAVLLGITAKKATSQYYGGLRPVISKLPSRFSAGLGPSRKMTKAGKKSWGGWSNGVLYGSERGKKSWKL
jgi:hypothetical protein